MRQSPHSVWLSFHQRVKEITVAIFVLTPILEEVEDRENLAIGILLKMAKYGDVTPVTNFFRQICGVKDKFWFEKCIAFAGC